MTGITIGGCALVRTVVGMAAGTGGAAVCTRQLEGRTTMVKRGRFPNIGGMAGSAALPESTAVSIFTGMTGITIGGGALVRTIIGMAASTGSIDMRTG